MKKILLSITAITAGLTVSAQGLNGSGDGWALNFTDGNSHCLANSAPNNGHHLNGDANTFVSGSYITTNGLEFTATDSSSNFSTDATFMVPHWLALPAVTGSGETAACVMLNDASENLDLSAAGNGKVAIDIQSDVAGAKFRFYLGGSGKWSPSSSTWNTGAGEGIIAEGTVSAANTVETIVFDFESLDATLWSGWAGKATIQSYGFAGFTSDAAFTISEIRFGAEVGVSTNEVVATGLNVYPNPATDVLNVKFDATSATTVELTDLTGKVVATQTAVAGANSLSFATANVNAGVYFVNISNANGNTAQKVVIK